MMLREAVRSIRNKRGMTTDHTGVGSNIQGQHHDHSNSELFERLVTSLMYTFAGALTVSNENEWLFLSWKQLSDAQVSICLRPRRSVLLKGADKLQQEVEEECQ